MYDFEILIKSFLRFGSLRRLLDSILHFYPDVVIRIVDDSKPENKSPQIPALHRNVITRILKERDSFKKHIKQYPNVLFYELPFDTGLSGGRNYLVDQVEKPYFLLMEDDFVITNRTKLDRLYNVITDSSDIVLVGGGVADWGKTIKRPGEIIIKNNMFCRIPYGHNAPRVIVAGVRCMPCKFTSNFFMASIDIFREHNLGWASEIKAGLEHALFFRSIPDNLRIYFTEECIVNHYPQENKLYAIFRRGRLKQQTDKLEQISGHRLLIGGGAAKYK